MSGTKYMCPFRKQTKTIGSTTGESFMSCDLEACNFCEIYDCGTHLVYRCDNPTAMNMGWIIKREQKGKTNE